MLSLQQLFIEGLDHNKNDSSDHYNREGCVGAIQRLKASNLFIALAAVWWGLKLLCCRCLSVALL